MITLHVIILQYYCAMCKIDYVISKQLLTLHYYRMISADLVTAAVLITFGVVYGFVSPSQIVIICLVEPLAMKLNEHIVVNYLTVSYTSDVNE